ncbi:MAG: glycoside hydrolase family 26 protein [Treponema sp.]|nr:glycoside hydrolase family 26 protein [Treponema sp.]
MKTGNRVTAGLVLSVMAGVGVFAQGQEPTLRERLLSYLASEYGKHILSGQMDTSWDDSMDMIRRVFVDTGKYPAIKGFDYLNIRNPSFGGGGSKQTEEAIAWWQNPPIPGKHGIVAFCWHWRMPRTGLQRAANDEFYTAFASNNHTTFRIPYDAATSRLKTESAEFSLIKEDLDLVAVELAKLKAAGVPVLWRPLHEASGNWFWWGTGSGAQVSNSPAAYKALWEYIYHYYVEVKALDNLVWVWNGQRRDLYPDPATVDIVGQDIYPAVRNGVPDFSSQFARYAESATYNSAPRIIAYTENGTMPDPDQLISDGAKWSFFMTWNDGWQSTQGQTDANNFWTGEYHNPQAHKEKVYRHEYTITLDELPDLSQYR